MERRSFRRLTAFERQLLETLLSASELDGNLRKDLERCRVRTIADFRDDYGSIEFEARKKGAKKHRPVAEARAEDVDGVPIEAILFASQGSLYELEILKVDGSPIIRMPPATDFAISQR